MDFSSNPTIPALKSGDVITIKADGYTDLTFKLVIDNDGKATLVEDDGKGDPYELHVKIDGSFEAAVVGQKDYDGVSSASVGGSSSNKNSAVKVYGALVEKIQSLRTVIGKNLTICPKSIWTEANVRSALYRIQKMEHQKTATVVWKVST